LLILCSFFFKAKEAGTLVKAITQEELKRKEEAMLQEVLERRLPHMKVFSNSWTSQSGSENSNAIWQKLGVGASHSLAVVIDKVMAYLEREETRVKEKSNNKANLSSLVSPLADRLSRKAFGMTLVQFNESLNYEAVQQEADQIWLVSRKGLKEGQDIVPRTVRRLESGWVCSCNMPVYLGVPCRHISCVCVKLQMAIPVQCVNSRWLKDSLQPEVRLKYVSPFQSKQASIVSDCGLEENRVDEMGMEMEIADFDQFVAENGGKFGEDSCIDSADVVVLDGATGKPLEKISPKERRNELTNYFYQLVQRIGFGKGSMETMDDLEQCLKNWEERHLKDSGGIGLAASVKTTGRPPEHALKPGNQKARSNAVRTKKPYKCGVCGKTGHTAGSKCPEKCMQCPAGTKNHKKGECPSKKRDKDLQEEEEGPKEKKKQKKKRSEGAEGSTVSTSVSSKGDMTSAKFYLFLISFFFFFFLQEASKMSKKTLIWSRETCV
jgi:hypothetical protein